MGLRVKDHGGSECRPVMGRIGVEAVANIALRESELTSARSLITTELGKAAKEARQIALVTAVGDNPARLRSEAGLARLADVAPIPASSGQTKRHRLNRGGDRSANSALHVAVIVRLRYCERTRAYAALRRGEGMSTPEIIRCLKRYLAREVFTALRSDFVTLGA